MKRIRIAALLALGLTTLGASLSPALSAPLLPSYDATLSDDGACTFTVVATWNKAAKVATVIARFFIDDGFNSAIFVTTMQAPFIAGNPNAGKLKGREATFITGPYVQTATPLRWYAIVDFYDGVNGSGTNLEQLFTNDLVESCALPPP